MELKPINDARSGGGQFTRVIGKIEQVLNSKSQMLKLCNPVFSPFIFYSKNSNIKPWIWRQLLLSCGYKTLTLLISPQIDSSKLTTQMEHATCSIGIFPMSYLHQCMRDVQMWHTKCECRVRCDDVIQITSAPIFSTEA